MDLANAIGVRHREQETNADRGADAGQPFPSGPAGGNVEQSGETRAQTLDRRCNRRDGLHPEMIEK